MGRIHIERVRSQADVPRERVKKEIPKVGHLGDLVVKNTTERARREDYAGLSAYFLRSSSGGTSTSTLDNQNLSHNLIIRAGAGLTGTTPTAANNQGDCQVYCQNGGLHTTTVVSSENNLAGGPSGAHWFRILYGDCTETASQEARNVGTLSASDFQRLCTDYAAAHLAPTQPPTTQPPPTTQATTQPPTEPPTEPIEPSSSAVPMELTSSYGYSSSVAESLAYISSSVPSSTYQQIVATTEAHTSSPAFSSTPVLIPASSQVPTATVLPNLITDGTTGAPDGVDGAAIGFSVLGVGGAVVLAVATIAGATKVIKSYLSYKEAQTVKEATLPVRYTNIPNS